MGDFATEHHGCPHNTAAAQDGRAASGPSSPRYRLHRIGPWEFIGFLWHGFRGNFAPWFDAITRYPEGFDTRVFGKRFILMNEPEAIEELLVRNQKHYHRRTQSTPLKVITGQNLLTLSGDPHLRQRRLVQPAFQKSRIDNYGTSMTELAELRSAGWQDGATVDIHREMMELTASIITKTLFSSGLEKDAHAVGSAIGALLDHSKRYVIPWLGRVLDRLPLPSTRVVRASLERLDTTIYRFIREHREAESEMDDLLSMLIAARYDDDTAMSDQQIRNECMALFLAGHETTATAISWTFYLLSQHPEVVEKLRAEVDAVLDAGRSPNADDFARLAYTRRVLTESMRMYPPVTGVDREAVTPNEVLGIPIQVGDLVLVSPLITHHDPRWYPEPERFDPDRWTPEFEGALPKYAYFPFGGGSRRCVGERFAWMEAVLLLAIFVRDWDLTLSPSARIQYKLNITLRPVHGISMIAHRRQKTITPGAARSA